MGNHNDYVGALCRETACDKMFTNLDTPGYTSFSRIGFLPFQWIEIFFGLLSLIESGCFSRWNSYKLWPKIVEPINNDDHVLCPAFIIFWAIKIITIFRKDGTDNVLWYRDFQRYFF